MDERTDIGHAGQRQSEIAEVLDLGREHSWLGRHKWLLLVGAALIVGAGALIYLWLRPVPILYKTESVTRQDLSITVSATGTLEPVNKVDVGVEISGTLKEVLVDFNDQVKAGDVMARIDTEQLEAQKKQAEANLAQAKAQLAQARASVTEASAQASRAKVLKERGFVSDQGLETAIANASRANAAIAAAKAQVALAEAALDANKTNLDKAVIRAPIDGIVLSRLVEPGQTVAAAFQTPTLFTLAEDLSHMELQVDIDEADIGTVKAGQSALFTVDAYPGRNFSAKILAVHNAPETVQGVVTYEAVMAVTNDDLALKPGMTATADILVNHLENALTVPNAALRFTPEDAEPSPPQPLTDGSGRSQARVFVLSATGKPEPREIVVGASDGMRSGLVSGDLGEGLALITDIDTSATSGGAGQ